MVAATPFRPDFCAADLKALARASKDANQTRRLFGVPPLKWSTNRDRFIPSIGGPEDGWKARQA